MNLTKRTLTKWRKEALEKIKELEGWDHPAENTSPMREVSNRILRMTQILLDQHLMKGK